MYKFTKTKDPSNKYDLAEIEYSVDAEIAEDVVDYFFNFMVGCGFGKQGILNAFRSVTEQNEE